MNVPVSTAYNKWTQFEQFPQFMEGVKQVRQLDAVAIAWGAWAPHVLPSGGPTSDTLVATAPLGVGSYTVLGVEK